jgi:hypothetical protein
VQTTHRVQLAAAEWKASYLSLRLCEMFTSLICIYAVMLLLMYSNHCVQGDASLDDSPYVENDVLNVPDRSNLRGSLSKQHFIFSRNLGFDQDQLSQIRTLKAKDANAKIVELMGMRKKNIEYLKGLSPDERITFKTIKFSRESPPHTTEFNSALD